MQLTPERIMECVQQSPWRPGHCLRLFWFQSVNGSRGELARQIDWQNSSGDVTIGLPLREKLFSNGNILMSDANKFFEQHRDQLEALHSRNTLRLSVVIVAATEFRLSQGGSPVILPTWFPVSASRETYFTLEDLGASAQVLLNAPEIRLDHISKLVYDLESALVAHLRAQIAQRYAQVEPVLKLLQGSGTVNGAKIFSDYRKHLDGVTNIRGYRPGAKTNVESLMSHLLALMVRSTPGNLADLACAFAAAMALPSGTQIKPVAATGLLRTSKVLSREEMNAHAMLTAALAAYQAQNAAAHASDYGTYPVALVYHASIDLRRALSDCVHALAPR
ncbi:hypothetical protein ABFU18_20170 [Xanthomonas campestris pv. campestris]|uniref:hypothetical protein n=1 Tax=Xanthomonas campestris TaxID=339 RepID=UPI001C85B674|nr:hypothetical protein [Xanthomonas campestris]MDM7693067.1 hypothetical protein [Xanthomonas campestris pv. campestris]MDM7840120.1 hypothetical protein [Xanthomonas campestris pv. campestris]MDM7876425.1 hypothetical protein [Xanthomonas campestris pv. campestris]